ncbi:MAG: helix-turn-helix transcriptional regulator [Alphaproteobacteria bacterium]|nr:helix-turn-helix transcriptional regulator [Alphaproteobacteria bacterium]
MEESVAADMLSALAHPVRLGLFRALVAVGPDGESAGALAGKLETPPSTLSHHLSVLERMGLISHKRQQRNLIYSAEHAAIKELMNFLVIDCCGGRPELCGHAASLPVQEEQTA